MATVTCVLVFVVGFFSYQFNPIQRPVLVNIGTTLALACILNIVCPVYGYWFMVGAITAPLVGIGVLALAAAVFGTAVTVAAVQKANASY